jgi:hypothetical protein
MDGNSSCAQASGGNNEAPVITTPAFTVWVNQFLLDKIGDHAWQVAATITTERKTRILNNRLYEPTECIEDDLLYNDER